MWSITAGQTGTLTAIQIGQITTVIQAAADYWSRYIVTGAATIDISFDVVELPGLVLATGGSELYSTETSGGFTYYASAAALEISTGVDQNGATADIFIEIDLGRFLADGFFLGPFPGGVSYGSAQRIDLWSVLIHEIAHGFGLLSLIDESATDRTEFDRYVFGSAGNYYFDGPSSEALTLAPSIAHLASSDLLGEGIAVGAAAYLSFADLSVFSDIGFTLCEATESADLLYGRSGGGNLSGAGGNDTLLGIPVGDFMAGGEGDDVIGGDAGADRLSGDNGADTIYGGHGADTLRGGSQFGWEETPDADLLIGGPGADEITGEWGDILSYRTSPGGVSVDLHFNLASGADATGDQISGFQNSEGSEFADTLLGNTNANKLIGRNGADYLEGGEGDDTLAGGAGGDRHFGGAGIDMADYAGEGAIRIDLATGTHAGAAAADVFDSIERFSGTAFNDTLIAGAAGVSFLGAGGGDSLIGGAGDDMLNGGPGADLMAGGGGVDVASYDDAATGVHINLQTGSVGGGAIGDTLTGIEMLTGSAFDDWFKGDALGNHLTGGDGADTLIGAEGNDTLGGDAGADYLDGGAGVDTLDLRQETGPVLIDLSLMTMNVGAEADTIVGFEAIIGSHHDDTLIGDDGANHFISVTGSMRGGAGADTIEGGDYFFGRFGGQADYSTSGAAVSINLLTGAASGGDAQGDVLINLGGVTGSAFADTLRGGDRGSALFGGDGGDLLIGQTSADAYQDTLHGGGGSDTLIGGDGGTWHYGGEGFDIVSYQNATGSIQVSLDDPGGFNSFGWAGGDRLIQVEGLIGSAYTDTLLGASDANFLFGSGGGDSITGAAGADTVIGGAGADSLDGGADTDMATYADATSAVTIRLWNGTGAGSVAQGDVLTSIENISGSTYGDALVGANSVANWIGGGLGNDYLAGLSGNDTLSGGGGDDLLQGGVGADRIEGGAQADTANYADATAAVTIRLWNGTGAGNIAAGDLLFSIENLIGSSFGDALIGANGVANRLDGGSGGDYLDGLSGEDTLVGGSGNDTLAGGTGNDRFDIATGSGADSIVDFTSGDGVGDMIRITGYGAAYDSFAEILAASTQIGADTVVNFGGGNTITLVGVSKTSLVADDFLFG